MATTKHKVFKLRSNNDYLLKVYRYGDDLDIMIDWDDKCVALPTLTKRQVKRLIKALQKYADGMK